MPDDERAAIERHIRELDRLAEDLDLLDREIAQSALDDVAIKRPMTITGVNLTVAAGLMAAIGDINRFENPQKLVSYFGLNPRVRQSGLGAAHHGRISKIGRSHARAMLVEAAWAAAKAPGPLHAFFVRIRARRGHQVRRRRRRAQAGCLVLAYAHQGRGLPLGPPALVANKLRAMELQAAAEGEPARACLRLQHQGLAQPGDEPRPPGREELSALRRRMAPAAAKGRGARTPQAGKAWVRQPGGAFSRGVALRHEVARATAILTRRWRKRLSISSVV